MPIAQSFTGFALSLRTCWKYYMEVSQEPLPSPVELEHWCLPVQWICLVWIEGTNKCQNTLILYKAVFFVIHTFDSQRLLCSSIDKSRLGYCNINWSGKLGAVVPIWNWGHFKSTTQQKVSLGLRIGYFHSMSLANWLVLQKKSLY